MHFGTAKAFLLFRRFRKPSTQKLSWEDTYREMAASDEDRPACGKTINHGLGGDRMKAKIGKFTGISDENLSKEQIMSLTREKFVNLVDSNVITFSLV